MEVRNNRSKWNHPIPVSLFKTHAREGILEIIDQETESLLRDLKARNPSILSTEIPIPIETILDLLDLRVTRLNGSKASGITQQEGSKLTIKLNTKQHYFRQRFTMAHELGHVWLNRIAGPFSFDELTKTKDTNHEVEFLCDVFASSLLMPKTVLLPYIRNDAIDRTTLFRIATDFKVSVSAVLRRLACVRGSLLLFWREIANPLKSDSECVERIEHVYPNLKQLHDYFVPLYSTARDTRFSPNIFVKSLEEQSDVSADVCIKDFGSLPEGTYRVHNIFFKRPTKTMYQDMLGMRSSFDMATILDVHSGTSNLTS